MFEATFVRLQCNGSIEVELHKFLPGSSYALLQVCRRLCLKQCEANQFWNSWNFKLEVAVHHLIFWFALPSQLALSCLLFLFLGESKAASITGTPVTQSTTKHEPNLNHAHCHQSYGIICAYLPLYIYIYVCVCMSMYVQYISIHIYMYIYIYILFIHLFMYLFLLIYIYMNITIFIYIYIFLYLYL